MATTVSPISERFATRSTLESFFSIMNIQVAYQTTFFFEAFVSLEANIRLSSQMCIAHVYTQVAEMSMTYLKVTKKALHRFIKYNCEPRLTYCDQPVTFEQVLKVCQGLL